MTKKVINKVASFVTNEKYSDFRITQGKLLTYCAKYSLLYLIGNGGYAGVLRDYLEAMGISIYANCITGMPSEDESAIRIFDLSEEVLHTAGFIYAVKEEYQEEINEELNEAGVEISVLNLSDDFYRICRDYMTYVRGKKKLDLLAEEERETPLSAYAQLEKKAEIVRSKPWIILQRQYGMGDAFYLEPIARKLNDLGYAVFISTDFGFVFEHASYLVEVFPFNAVPQWILDRAFLINFMNAYEKRPFMHILDAYIRQLQELMPDFSLDESMRIPVYDKNLIRDHDKANIKKICINFEASEWKSRMYPREKTKKIVQTLADRGYEIYEIGCNEDYYLGIGKNCYGMSFPETMKLMSGMDLYLGLDNGLMHFAQSIHLPIFILFGCTCPLYRVIDWQNARVMWKSASKLVCAGCHHRIRIPQNYTYCGRDRHYCMDWSAAEVLAAFDNLEYGHPPVLEDIDRTPISWLNKEWSDKE